MPEHSTCYFLPTLIRFRLANLVDVSNLLFSLSLFRHVPCSLITQTIIRPAERGELIVTGRLQGSCGRDDSCHDKWRTERRAFVHVYVSVAYTRRPTSIIRYCRRTQCRPPSVHIPAPT